MPVPSSALTTQHTASYRSYCTLQLPELDFLGRGLWPVQGRNQLSQTNFGPKKFWHINHHKSSSEGTIYFGYMSSVKCLKNPSVITVCFFCFSGDLHNVWILCWFLKTTVWFCRIESDLICTVLSVRPSWRASCPPIGRLKLIVRILVCN